MNKGQEELLTFGGHLEVLRRALFRIIAVIAIVALLLFIHKSAVFDLLLAATDSDFCLYEGIERMLSVFGVDFRFEYFEIKLISTELSAQFMMHITSSLYMALLITSPYILYEIFAFVSPALYENEKHTSIIILVVIYLLFFIGVFLNYFIIFPISFRFLSTYQVASVVENTITLSSYIHTFATMTFVMGLVFQLPVVTYLLAKMELITSDILLNYRKHAVLLISIISAIITPPDILSCILVITPLCLLYECSIYVAKWIERTRYLSKKR